MVRSLNRKTRCVINISVLLVLAASRVYAADLQLSWTDNSNNETGFTIERKTGTSGTFAQIATVGANVTSYTNTGLAAATTYCYRLRAYNTAGNSAYTAEACKATPAAATTFDFSLTNGGDKSVTRGQSVSNTINATLSSGSTQPVSLLTSGLPGGATASYSTSNSCSPTCSRTLNIMTTTSTPIGNYPITVTGTGAGITKTTTFILAVSSAATAPASSNTFALEAESGSLTAPMVVRSDGAAFGGKFVEVPEGSGNNYADGSNGGPGEVRFAINIPQSGTRALWARTIAPSGASDSFYVTRNGALVSEWSVPTSTTWKWNKVANISLGAGTSNLAFRQREDGTKLDQIILSTDLNFVPGNSAPPPASNFDFSLAHGGNKSVTRGQSVSNVITATLTSGSSQAVTFATSGLPSGATASYGTSNSCNPTCSRTLNITTSTSTPTGNYAITVTGTGAGITKSATFNLGVTSQTTAGFDFALTNGGNKSVIQGSSTTITYTATLVSGTSQSVSFAVSGLPQGASGSFSQTSCTPSCSGSLAVTTSSSTPTGAYSLVVKGTASGGSSRSTTVTLNVNPDPEAEDDNPAPQQGLTGYWSLNEGTGTVAKDSSGNGNSGKLLNGPAWLLGKSGQALLFDGSNDYVEVPHTTSLNLSSALTISLWINNQTLTGADEQRIIASKGHATNGGSWTLTWSAKSGLIVFYAGRSTSYRYVSIPYNNTQVGKWHHIAAVVKSGTITLYLDGALKAGPSGLDSSTIRTSSDPIRIASLGSSSTALRNWDGLIDEVRVYNRALSAAEIVSLYQQ